MVNRCFNLGAGLLAVAFLSSCAVSPKQPLVAVAPQWQAHVAALDAITNWSFTGRASLYDGKQGWHATMWWQQEGAAFDVRFNGPFGGGALHIYGDANQTTLELPDQPLHTAATPEELMRSLVGWSMPVDHLKYWLLGRPDPGYPLTAEWDQAGRLAHLQQDGWSIEYRAYAEQEKPVLPHKLEITHPQLRVKIVIDQWQLARG